MDSIRYLKPSEGWCSMELKLHYSSSSEKRRPGSQTMFTCRDTSYPCRKHKETSILSRYSKQRHYDLLWRCLIVVTWHGNVFYVCSFLLHNSLAWAWRFKATLKIKCLCFVIFFNCQINFQSKMSSKAQSSHHVLILKSDLEQMYSLKKDCRGVRYACANLYRILTHSSWTITRSKEHEMANKVSGPRSHYSMNTLRIMKLGQGDGKLLLECTEPLHISVWTHNTVAMWQMIANTEPERRLYCVQLGSN